MRFTDRARNYWACVSILFNQTLHFGGAPYPLTLSETCYARQGMLRYDVGMLLIDSFFELFGEYNHCRNAYIKGLEARRLQS